MGRLMDEADDRDRRAEGRDRAAEARDDAVNATETAAERRRAVTGARSASALDRRAAGLDRDRAAADRAELLDELRRLDGEPEAIGDGQRRSAAVVERGTSDRGGGACSEHLA